MTDSTPYPRDLIGYGRNPPHPRWPGEARIAIQFVINYEEGAERCLLHGDGESEAFLSDISGAQPWPGQRHMNMESIYEFGARAGFWRLHRMFTARNMPVTVFGVAKALERNPEAVAAMNEAGWEIASHGLRWIDYRNFSEADERAHIAEAVRIQTEVAGSRPLGFYQGRTGENTLPLTMAEGGFLYSADTYADELPYWVEGPQGPFLMVPYTLEANDMRFAIPEGYASGDDFFAYLRDSFDLLYAEGETAPRMLSVGLHCRLVGRPGRAQALARFLDHIAAHENVWVTTRLDIARHWIANHPPKGGYVPSRMSRPLFMERFGGIIEHSPFIAAAVYDAGLTPAHDTAEGLRDALLAVLNAASVEQQLAVINQHPDLAGRLAAAKMLTADSTEEQSSAGLDSLTEEEKARFTVLNADYVVKFGFVFIMAVRGAKKDEIIAAFERRLTNTPDEERKEALAQIARICLMRLQQILPSAA
ncbi:chitin deacetylase [Azorhizobium oxalatiphilum]|uniref:Chitooligosaccharide deacetylase n=1 Tax=Azorhizobium oxalatiphilum TaxID=980631 RepID=A0A917BM29_9HYPH|nr:allantoinase PuuE [Azorhizobium oxalatiphilum]GGF49028.1 chitin deacetylase [Azorhizobium oxalatiphilum]